MLPRVSSLLTYWPCLRHWSTSVKKPEHVTAQCLWRSHSGFRRVMNRLLQRCHRRSQCPDARLARWSLPRLCPGARTAFVQHSKGMLDLPANSRSCILVIRIHTGKKGPSKGLAGEGGARFVTSPPSLPQLALPGCSPQAANPAVAAAARQQQGHFVPVHITDCLMVVFWFFLLTLIIIVSPSIDTQTP